jgi:hypothetical protein
MFYAVCRREHLKARPDPRSPSFNGKKNAFTNYAISCIIGLGDELGMTGIVTGELPCKE